MSALTGPEGPERKGSTVAEKKIQPKAAGTEAASKTTAAGVQKKSLKQSHKQSQQAEPQAEP